MRATIPDTIYPDVCPAAATIPKSEVDPARILTLIYNTNPDLPQP